MKNLKNFGKWAIVTGSSSGIGEEFANRLASLGHNIVLIARREVQLAEVAKNLQNSFNVETKIIPLDLTADNALDVIKKEIEGLDVGLLISNAGIAEMGAYTKVPYEKLDNEVQLNVNVQLKLTHYFSKFFQNKGKGGIIMVSTAMALQGVPYAANYSASKSYVLNLGEALNYELKKDGVHVTAVMPGPTDTVMITNRTDADMSGLPMKPQSTEALVKESLKALSKNKPTVVGGRMPKIMGAMGKRVMSRKGNVGMWGKMMHKMVHLK